jgi:cystathionine gamma-synthase
MRAHEQNARRTVERLATAPCVARVYCPGLADQLRRMVSFELVSAGTIRRFLPELRLFSLAEPPGGVESLIAHPATMTHASMTPEARAEAAISDTLLRLSVGIEHAEDLVEVLRKH